MTAASAAPLLNALFVYGTLMVPEVVYRVAGKRFAGSEARLHGFRRGNIAGQVFPGIVAEPGASTKGIVYRGLSRQDFAAIDRFEDDFYRRQRLEVVLDEGGTCTVYGYVVSPRYRHVVTTRPWHLEHFVNRHLDRYIAELFPPP